MDAASLTRVVKMFVRKIDHCCSVRWSSVKKSVEIAESNRGRGSDQTEVCDTVDSTTIFKDIKYGVRTSVTYMSDMVNLSAY